MLITVVTPTLNAIRYLHDCIDSTRGQESSEVQVEHIVVDGGSTDGTVDLARARGCTVITGKDEGIFDAINKGSYMASGELLGVLGSDDMFLPGALDRVARRYRQGARRWLVGGERWLDGTGRPRGDIAAPPTWITTPILASLGWMYLQHPATYVHRDLFKELGGYDISFRYYGDYDFVLRALEREPFSRINQPLTSCRRHGGNASMQQSPVHSAETRRIMRRYGPPSRRQEVMYRYLLKVWVNGTNPGWFLHKRMDGVRARRVAQPSG
jgi:glycosyltransferase involved in cell wall biosynthesis